MDVTGMTRPEIILRETAEALRKNAEHARRREAIEREAAEVAEQEMAEMLEAANTLAVAVLSPRV